jgi:Na+/H+ antiporter NhaD/arsenite permease-like protein
MRLLLYSSWNFVKIINFLLVGIENMEGPISNFAFWAMGICFFLGYAAIVLEHKIRVNKAASAILTASALWMIYFASSTKPYEVNLEILNKNVGSISEIIFFLMGAMTIVELIDSHNGFKLLTDLSRPMSKKMMMAVIATLTFFMSSVLDNLTTTLVMATLLKCFISDHEERMLVGGLIVIAANAGGAWTPIGDVTTTMLWINGNITSLATMKSLILPSLTVLVVATFWLTRSMKGSFEKPDLSLQPRPIEPGGKLIMLIGLLTFIMVPFFKMATHLPAYMGILVGLSILWIVTDWLHHHHQRHSLMVSHALTRIDSSTLLFFLGILLSIGALEHAHVLNVAAYKLDVWFGSKALIVTAMGLISAIIDNVPLVAASMSMYSLADYPVDHALWQWIAYCAGTGGSIFIIGSASGVALMGLEGVSFMWYVRKIAFCAFGSYLAGLMVLACLSQIP